MPKTKTASLVKLKSLRMTTGIRTDDNGVDVDEITVTIKGLITYSPSDDSPDTEAVEKLEVLLTTENAEDKKIIEAVKTFAEKKLKAEVDIE